MRLQLRYVALSWAVSCACSIALAPPAQAQSFIQKLLGLDSGTTPQRPAMRVPTRPLPSARFYNRERRWYPKSEAAEEDVGPPDSGGPYRTMCVRTCDGYYFPLRHNAWHRNFASDVKSCRNACGEQARLFYFPENGGSIDTMTSLDGRPYTELPNAFAYRKALVSGCSCKPAPWSREEAARHQSYAVAETAKTQTSTEPAASEPTAQFDPAMAQPTGDPTPAEDASIADAVPSAPLSYRIMRPARSPVRGARRKAKGLYARLRIPQQRVVAAPKKASFWLID